MFEIILCNKFLGEYFWFLFMTWAVTLDGRLKSRSFLFSLTFKIEFLFAVTECLFDDDLPNKNSFTLGIILKHMQLGVHKGVWLYLWSCNFTKKVSQSLSWHVYVFRWTDKLVQKAVQYFKTSFYYEKVGLLWQLMLLITEVFFFFHRK